jgi:small basic protein
MTTADAIIRLILIGGMLLLLVGGLVGIMAIWFLRGRDPHTGLVADILSVPPDDLPPGAAGALLDEHADHEDVVATLLGLGRHGAVTIVARPAKNPKARDYLITLVDPAAVANRIERDMLEVLFGASPAPGQSTLLSQVRGAFTRHEPKVRDDLYAELVRRGYFAENPHATRVRWRRIAWSGLFASVLVGLLVTVLVDPFGILTTLAAVAVWGVLVPVSRHMPRKTTEGAEAAAKWRAFRRYLESLTTQRDLPEAGEIFDRYLAYAVAFRLERQWIGAFAARGARTPGWFGMPDVGDVVIIGDIANTGEALGNVGGAIGSVGVPDVSMPDLSMPDVQGLADTLGGSLQAASDGLGGLLDVAGSIFDAIDFDL